MPIKDLFKDVPNKDKEAEGNSISSQDKKIVCPNCGAEANPTDVVCSNCGTNLWEESESSEGQRYPALYVVSNIYVILAIAVVAVTALITVAELGMGLRFAGIAGGIGSLIFVLITIAIGGIIALSLFAFSEAIKVFMDIEANTRKSAEITNMVNRDEK